MPVIQEIAKRIQGYMNELADLESQLEPFKNRKDSVLVSDTVKKLQQTQAQLDRLTTTVRDQLQVNDEVIAKELQENQVDIQKLTSGKIDAEDFETHGKGDGVRTLNDEVIAKEFQENQNDIHKLTSGQIEPEVFETKGKLPGNDDANAEDTDAEDHEQSQ